METSQFTIKFPSGQSAQVVLINKTSTPEEIILKLNHPKPVMGIIPISGGALDYPDEVVESTNRLIRALLELAFEHHIMLVDGGTNTGVMRLIGQNFLTCTNRMPHVLPPPLIGFSPKNKVSIPNGTRTDPNLNNLDKLDENHPYFVLINDAKDWGDEVDHMFSLVNYMSQRVPSVALVANGGLTTIKEVSHSLKQNRRVVVLEGTKRAARLIVLALQGASTVDLEKSLTDPEARLIKSDDKNREVKLNLALSQLDEIRNYTKITVFNLDESSEKLKQILSGFLSL